MVTYYVVQAFNRGKRGALIAEEPKQVPSQRQCEALAERLAETSVAVVAFSRTGDPKTGDWEDAVVLAQYGQLPDEIMEMTA